VALGFGAVRVIPAGHKGVVFDSIKGVMPVALNEGLNFVTPFIQEVIVMDIRINRGEYDANAASKDLQDVHTKVTVNVHPNDKTIANLYKMVGIDYLEKVVHPAVQESLKAVTAQYTAEELVTKREQVKQKIHNQLEIVLKKFDITLVETYITDFDFSKAFSAAIEAKQVAAQEVMRAENDLRRVKVEAEQKIAQYRAEAEGLRLKQQAITPLMVKMEAIRAWNGVLPQVMLGGGGSSGGGVPFLDISQLKGWDSPPKPKAAAETAKQGNNQGADPGPQAKATGSSDDE
jgi:regulator of protease activity HflC (stomatin/prohibitin superfamily)